MLALFNSVFGTWVRFRTWDAGSNPGLGIEQGNQRHHISRLFQVHQSPISASQTNKNSAITDAVNAWDRLGVGVRLGRVQKHYGGARWHEGFSDINARVLIAKSSNP